MRPHPLLPAPLCTLVLLVAGCVGAPDAPAPERSARSARAWVDPRIGTDGHGHTYPGATVPFGMVQLSPDTRLSGWDGCSGYHASDTAIYGFSHTHLSGTGIEDGCDLLLRPAMDAAALAANASQPFGRATEHAEPGYYAVTLDPAGIRAELTATARTGLHRYTFPPTATAHLVLDLRHRDQLLGHELRVTGPGELSGFRRSRAWAQDQTVYFVVQLSRPPASLTLDADGTVADAVLDTRTAPELLVRVGLSAVSVDGARRNLAAELPHWDFDRVRAAAATAWDQVLDRIEFRGGSDRQQRIAYTALYHCCLAPTLWSDVDGQYRGADRQVHHADHPVYTVFSLWDTFRALHPLLTLIDPERSRDFVRSLLLHAQQTGRLPTWELWGEDTDCMIGYHAAAVIADAWAKGVRGFDAEAALAAMVRTARQDRLGLAAYRDLGYVPADQEPESVSKTLEYAFDDACIADFARALGHADLAQEFGVRCQAWRHLFDPTSGFFRARSNGGFAAPFDPREVNFHYTEANAWQYSLFVPHDLAGLAAAHGGEAKLAAHVDALFTADAKTTGRDQADITGQIGQYAHGNEPSHHVAYLYAALHQPWQTQARVRQILDTLHGDGPDGLPGNEDCGQMSAWIVLSALGLYCVTPGSDLWVLGTPWFPHARLRLPGGATFTLTATGVADPYLQSGRLDGAPFARTFLRHAELLRGGRLELTLGPRPNPAFGAGAEAAPMSRRDEPQVVPAPVLAAPSATFHDTLPLTLMAPAPDSIVRYTLDGSEPGADAPAASAALTLTDTRTVRAAAFRADGARSPVVTGRFTRVPPGRRVTLRTAYAPMYAAGGDQALVDGQRGGPDFRTGGWQGFRADLTLEVDLGAEVACQRVALGFLQDPKSWIWLPDQVALAVSQDGLTWQPAGECKDAGSRSDRRTHDFAFDLGGRRVRFLRLTAPCPTCPKDHPGAGEKGWLFADEVVVETTR